ncbi:MAG: HAD family hydrolase [Myxococcales bacterium]
MQPTVLLFDIDGTLVTTGGVGRRAIERAFERVFGRPDACALISFDGMTDHAIFRAALTAIGQPADMDAIQRMIAVYLEELAAEVQRCDMRRYIVHDGMVEVLDEAARHAHLAIGLGTGNVREGARVKLDRVDLYRRFSFGGFGCDHEARPELIRRGAERGAEKLGVPLRECRVVVIGDTPKDVSAAQAIGAECVGVGTGAYRPEALLACGATRAFESLRAPGALEFVLGV